ncbi:hypothetical protein Lepto7375DRAFT_8125 [Leptolyngbya sp. PCC 7375]|nr:hypothetical protein Lepto7375DRAFT_8125 [Leptolyngbya sp. PCC 7375]
MWVNCIPISKAWRYLVPRRKATMYTQVLKTSIFGCLTPSNSPLVRGRTGVSPLGKGGLRGVIQDFELTSEMCVHGGEGQPKEQFFYTNLFTH